MACNLAAHAHLDPKPLADADHDEVTIAAFILELYNDSDRSAAIACGFEFSDTVARAGVAARRIISEILPTTVAAFFGGNDLALRVGDAARTARAAKSLTRLTSLVVAACIDAQRLHKLAACQVVKATGGRLRTFKRAAFLSKVVDSAALRTFRNDHILTGAVRHTTCIHIWKSTAAALSDGLAAFRTGVQTVRTFFDLTLALALGFTRHVELRLAVVRAERTTVAATGNLLLIPAEFLAGLSGRVA